MDLETKVSKGLINISKMTDNSGTSAIVVEHRQFDVEINGDGQPEVKEKDSIKQSPVTKAALEQQKQLLESQLADVTYLLTQF